MTSELNNHSDLNDHQPDTDTYHIGDMMKIVSRAEIEKDLDKVLRGGGPPLDFRIRKAIRFIREKLDLNKNKSFTTDSQQEILKNA